MKLLDSIKTLVKAKSTKPFVYKNHSCHHQKNDNNSIINGKFKVVPTLDEQMAELDGLCERVNADSKIRTKEYKEDTRIWNEAQTGYANPYTAPIER